MSMGDLCWAERSRPIPGEVESGDLHLVMPFPGGALLAVVDGLGHGREAAAAARLATDTLRVNPARRPADLIADCHAALRGSRGAAMLVVSLWFTPPGISWAGVGNVEGWQIGRDGRAALLSRPGVVGYQIPAPAERNRALAPGDLLVLASDGISAGFVDLIAADCDLEQTAAAVLSTHARASDDALVLLARYGTGAAA